MGKPLIIKYTYIAECSFDSEHLEKSRINTRELVDSFFLLCDDKSNDYTKIKTLDNELCRGILINKSSNYSSITLELNEVINTVLITAHSSKSIVTGELDNIIIKQLTPNHFHSQIIERYMP
mgnify:CR=1 FL=1